MGMLTAGAATRCYHWAHAPHAQKGTGSTLLSAQGFRAARLPVSAGQAAQDAQQYWEARYLIETFISNAPGGSSLTWSEAIFSDAPTVLDIVRLPEVRDVLLTR